MELKVTRKTAEKLSIGSKVALCVIEEKKKGPDYTAIESYIVQSMNPEGHINGNYKLKLIQQSP